MRQLFATAKDLKQEVAGGLFRQDLLYRLSVIPLHIPPLRDRTKDIPLLVNHFLSGFNQKRGMALSLSTVALQCLLNYTFPNNVRELKNIIERVRCFLPVQSSPSTTCPLTCAYNRNRSTARRPC